MSQIGIFTIILSLFCVINPIFAAEKCRHPQPAPNYRNDLYQGRWFEIGKVHILFYIKQYTKIESTR
jgi:lipocalin